jgi:hypothetical protein
MTDDLKHLEQLIIDFKESLEREMREGNESIRREMREGFQRLENVTRRHSGMIVSGTVAIGTITKSITRQEAAIRDLQARVRKLEARRNGKKR